VNNRKNAFKVGLAIIAALLIFFFGIRYFEDIPITGSKVITTSLDRVDGLLEGTSVNVSGVRVGSVMGINLVPRSGEVTVELRLDKNVELPVDTYAKISGMAAFGSVQLELVPGSSSEMIADGGHLEGRTAGLLDVLGSAADEYMGKADSLIAGVEGSLENVNLQLEDPNSDLRGTLSSLRSVTQELDRTIRSQRNEISAIMSNLQTSTGSLSDLSASSSEGLPPVIDQLGATLKASEATANNLTKMSADLNELITSLNQEGGTLGLLASDPALYNKLDSTLTNLNKLIVDFQADPKRYLKHLDLVEIF